MYRVQNNANYPEIQRDAEAFGPGADSSRFCDAYLFV